MSILIRLLGSLTIAVPLLVTIAAVLGWGTFYEARFGTAAVQHFIYQSWWFHALLGFLALNLAVAALTRFPWQRRHIPFVLAHIGIISTLAGGIIGGRLGIEGQMIIPEGTESSALQLPYNVLTIHQPNPGIHRELKTNFEATAWNHEPHALFQVPMPDHEMRLVVDRYYPNASVEEEITDEGNRQNPAVHLRLSKGDEEDALWLLADDPDRFGARWGETHLFFFKPVNKEELYHLFSVLPIHSIALIQLPSGTLAAVLTGAPGQKETIPSLQVGRSYSQPWLGFKFEVTAIYPQAAVVQHFANRDNEVRQEVIHIVAQRGEEVAQGWVGLRGSLELPFHDESLFLEYRPAQRQLPVTVKLLQFRKIDYPGIQMASGFESDVELTDEARGLTLKRTIRMNNPLKYRGFTFYQSSYIQGPVQIPPDGGTFLDRNFKEATVLSVRKDPGVPLVYAGFLIIVAGVVSMFLLRKPAELSQGVAQ